MDHTGIIRGDGRFGTNCSGEDTLRVRSRLALLSDELKWLGIGPQPGRTAKRLIWLMIKKSR
jgi:hypothetical protein